MKHGLGVNWKYALICLIALMSSSSICATSTTRTPVAHEDNNERGLPDNCAPVNLFNEEYKLMLEQNLPEYALHYFGDSVSLSGDVAIVGAPLTMTMTDEGEIIRPGSAHIFRFDGTDWNSEALLFASDGAHEDHFGRSVSISGDTAIVGASEHDALGEQSGAAYIYRFDGGSWVEEAKILANDGAAWDVFGSRVSISGDTAITGAHGNDDQGNFSGSAYIFRFDGATWVEEVKLLASDGGYAFGYSVSISDDIVIVGASFFSPGSAYIYRFDGSVWNEEAILNSTGVPGSTGFGLTVSISGGTAIVGAPTGSFNDYSGSAYIYRFDGSTWVEETHLLASDGAYEDHFGWSVSISSDRVIVGAPRNEDDGFGTGSAYIYHFDGSSWNEEIKLLASDIASDTFFGSGVTISGDTVIVGSPESNNLFDDGGAAYFYSGVSDCNLNGVHDACDIEDGTSDDLNGDGVPDECQCIADLSGDGMVNVNDLLAIIRYWGTNITDLNNDGIVDMFDLFIVIDNWGPCQ